MKIEQLCLVISALLSCALAKIDAKANRPPRFSVGGDMAHFSIPENVDVGSTIYKLRGTDPEGSSVYFSISGEYFSVNKFSGDVTLIRELDRELNNSVEVIISITDEPKNDAEANTVSIRREIPIIDVNDNPPIFTSSQYSLSVSEITKVGTTVYTNITISDRDSGVNSMVNLFCVQSPACQIFSVSLQILSEGFYKGIITLVKPLNYEVQSSHTLWLKAIDSNPKNSLDATAKVIIDVEDVQDQPPIFLNTPYSISVLENTLPKKTVLHIGARDGDVNNLRSISFSLEEDVLGYFSIEDNGNGNASLVTTNTPIDREDPIIVQMGGIYTFYVKAREIVNDNLPSDETRELITIVILDENDQLPRFNQAIFYLNVSEDIGVGTPLPGLGLIASDDDVGENARFSLYLRASDPLYTDCFSLEPMEVTRRSSIIIRVVDNSKLDYESGVRNIKLYVVAYDDEHPDDEAVAEINLNIVDVDDNLPEFNQQTTFVVNVSENTNRGTVIANMTAIDRDFGLFSEISYSVGGFGMEKFDTDSKNGGLILVGKLDFENEHQKTYSLTLKAKDGGNRTSTANIIVNVLDVNDNAPIFEMSEYRRHIREGFTVFQPPFYVKANDKDGPEYNRITYSILSSNSEVIGINKDSGELSLLSPASAEHTPKGQYELKIQANDSGIPSLSSVTQVLIQVGVPGNQRPVFEGTPYNVTIPETLAPNSLITTVRATDPDGLDEILEYKLAADADNFYIKPTSGMIYLAENADLSTDSSSPRKYHFKVLAIDNGVPFRETAQTTVTVNVIDVNDKPPAFNESHNYVAYLPETTKIGSVVMKIKADDPDENADVRYRLLKPYQVFDKRGFLLKQDSNDYDELFSMNEVSGEIYIQKSLENLTVHVITVRVEARDRNAAKNIDAQVDTVDVTFFIEVTDKLKPVFLNNGWMRSFPLITHSMPEEMPIGSNVITILAQDPVTLSPITKFRVKSLPRQFAMDPIGNVVVTERIDYETIPSKVLSFTVEAISDDSKRTCETNVAIYVTDVNDHAPRFLEKYYQISVTENSKKGTSVLVVNATDGDLITSPLGYGNISYHLSGEHAFLFEINSTSGEIKVGSINIDREKQPALNLVVVAMDTPLGGKEIRKSEVPIQVDVLDVNDNAPAFKEKDYSAVILENFKVESSVINVTAVDPDIGPAGIVKYRIVHDFDGSGLFKMNSETGEITVQKVLSGKGRTQPYSLMIRAEDNGNPAMFSDKEVTVLIGDVVTNDGIPIIVSPSENEVANISEDAPLGSIVFHVRGTDPDDPFTPEGRIQYSFLKSSTDVDDFNIDSKTGVITTRVKLDREVKSNYSLVLVVKDGGAVPQQVTKGFHITVGDVDDNIPLFKRAVDDKPIHINIEEEIPIGTVVGTVGAVDPDEKQNADIDYLITEGNEENLFSLTSTDNSALIQSVARIDREKISHVLLTVKCFRKREKPRTLFKKYNKTFEDEYQKKDVETACQDFSERQIYIKILDVDDNSPSFKEKNISVGVRFSTPIDFLLLTVTAEDVDAEAEPMLYRISNFSFFHLPSKKETRPPDIPILLNERTGELRTNSSLRKYVDGYFSLEITATNGILKDNQSTLTVKVYVIRERGLLRFVFSKSPSEVKEYLSQFKSELENALTLPSVQLNVIETQFHSKSDDNYDFSRTSTCFQLIMDNNYDAKEAETIFNDDNNDQLKLLYKKYNVEAVERCGNSTDAVSLTWVQISLLSIAIFIGITSVVSSCILCCSYGR